MPKRTAKDRLGWLLLEALGPDTQVLPAFGRDAVAHALREFPPADGSMPHVAVLLQGSEGRVDVRLGYSKIGVERLKGLVVQLIAVGGTAHEPRQDEMFEGHIL